MAAPEKGASVAFVIKIAHLNMTLYSTFFWIQTGVMPYLSRRLGMDTVVFGYLQTTFAVIQLLGGPIFGRFGDLFGGRAALFLAYISSGLTYLLMGLSTNVSLLFLSRIPSIFMHGMQAAQMVVTDLSTESERTSALGKLGLSFGVGMMVGSLSGGVLISRFGEPAAAYVAAMGSFLNAVIALKYIPANTKPRSVKQQLKTGQANGNIFSLKTIMRLLRIPGAAKIFAIKTISGIPTGVFQSMFSLVAMDYFKLEAEHNGYLMAYIGLLQMVMQGLAVGWLTKWIPEKILLLCSILLVCLLGLATAVMTSVFHFCVICVPMSLGIATFYLTTNSILTKLAPAADTGAMLGLGMSVHSLIRSVSPTIGAFLFDAYGFPSFGYLQFGMNLLLFLSLCPSTCSGPFQRPN